MHMQFTLCESDAAKYPDGGTPIVYDSRVFENLPASELEALENHLPDELSFFRVERGLRNGSAVGMRGAMYLARRRAGVNEKWENFDPLIWQTDLVNLPSESPDPTGSATDGSPTS